MFIKQCIIVSEQGKNSNALTHSRTLEKRSEGFFYLLYVGVSCHGHLLLGTLGKTTHKTYTSTFSYITVLFHS